MRTPGVFEVGIALPAARRLAPWLGSTAVRTVRVVVVFARLLDRRTWLGTSYAVMSVVMAATVDAAVVVCVCLSAGLLVLYIGFPLLAFTLELASHVAGFERRRVEAFLGTHIPDPHGGAPIAREGARLGDAVSWKEASYAFCALALGPL